jgi:hypothetical protein
MKKNGGGKSHATVPLRTKGYIILWASLGKEIASYFFDFCLLYGLENIGFVYPSMHSWVEDH